MDGMAAVVHNCRAVRARSVSSDPGLLPRQCTDQRREAPSRRITARLTSRGQRQLDAGPTPGEVEEVRCPDYVEPKPAPMRIYRKDQASREV